MSPLDGITAVLAIPAVEENSELRDARPGEAVLDDYVKGLEDRFAAFTARDGDQPSGMDEAWSELLNEPVRVGRADFGIYEKKGLAYPAILMDPAQIAARDGSVLVDVITKRFRDDSTRAQLAELLGTRLGVDWVSIFTTFGASS
ncbi:MAG: hypothetical protein JSV45_01405 [Chromatiales bacterium]|nr:MAG: hypothetical protein JSV45_01405 [Chromatiales bacterium]